MKLITTVIVYNIEMLNFLLKHKSDSELMNILQDGNKLALKVLFERHYKLILNYCFGLTGNTELSEDITQETFFKVYDKRMLFDKKYNFKTWSLRISRNLVFDFMKKKKELLLGDDLDYEYCDEIVGLDMTLDKNLKREVLHEHIQKLKIEQKEALVLWLYGHSYVEIAELTSKSSQACKNLVNRAKQALILSIKFSENEKLSEVIYEK